MAFSNSFLLAPSFWDYIASLFSTIPKVMYMLFASSSCVLDVLQLFMRKLVGLDVYFVEGSSEAQSGDIVARFLSGVLGINGVAYPALNVAFWSLITLSMILLVLFTIVAVIKNQYAPKEGKITPATATVGKALRAVGEFAIVPITCLIGIWLGNIILTGLDQATSASVASGDKIDYTKLEPYGSRIPNGSKTYVGYDLFGFGEGAVTTPFSGTVFAAAAYNANRIRNGYYGSTSEFDTFGFIDSKETSPESMAYVVDMAFANRYRLKSDMQRKIDLTKGTMAEKICLYSSIDIFSLAYPVKVESFSKFNASLVWYYYDLWKFDFLIGFACIVVMLGLFLNIIMGLAARIFDLVGLFIISPPIVAMRPIDDGAALGKWREKFVSKALMAYGSIVGMNVFMLIFPYIHDIKFFNIPIVDSLISSLFIIAGLVSVKAFVALVSSLIGADDANKVGGDMAKDMGSTLAKAGKLTAGAAGVAMKATKFLPGTGMIAGVAGKALAKGATKVTQKVANSKIGKGISNAISKGGGFIKNDLNTANSHYETEQAKSNEIFDQGDLNEKQVNRARSISDKYTKQVDAHMKNGLTNEEAREQAAKDVGTDIKRLGINTVNNMSDFDAKFAGHENSTRNLSVAKQAVDVAQQNSNSAKARYDNKLVQKFKRAGKDALGGVFGFGQTMLGVYGNNEVSKEMGGLNHIYDLLKATKLPGTKIFGDLKNQRKADDQVDELVIRAITEAKAKEKLDKMKKS